MNPRKQPFTWKPKTDPRGNVVIASDNISYAVGFILMGLLFGGIGIANILFALEQRRYPEHHTGLTVIVIFTASMFFLTLLGLRLLIVRKRVVIDAHRKTVEWNQVGIWKTTSARCELGEIRAAVRQVLGPNGRDFHRSLWLSGPGSLVFCLALSYRFKDFNAFVDRFESMTGIVVEKTNADQAVGDDSVKAAASLH